jgi:hypothetical protein
MNVGWRLELEAPHPRPRPHSGNEGTAVSRDASRHAPSPSRRHDSAFRPALATLPALPAAQLTQAAASHAPGERNVISGAELSLGERECRADVGRLRRPCLCRRPAISWRDSTSTNQAERRMPRHTLAPSPPSAPTCTPTEAGVVGEGKCGSVRRPGVYGERCHWRRLAR